MDQEISFEIKNKNVSDVFEIIESKTTVRFNYKSGILPTSNLEYFKAEKEKISSVLSRLLSPFNLQYFYFGGNSVIIKPIKKSPKNTFTISGYVLDKFNGEKLIGASVYCLKNKVGTFTNDYGFFSLTLPMDSVYIEFRYVGYERSFKKYFNNANVFYIVELMPKNNLKEVEIREESEARSEFSPGKFELNLKAIKEIPSFMGEPDVIRAVQTVPGVLGAGESAGGINVRGGGTDQNLVLIDGVPVYNIVHVFGLFSIINPGVVNTTELVKGAFSAKYNGRLSSIFDIKLKDGNYHKLGGSVNVGMLLSSITLEGPLIKNRSSFMLSFRRTYFDLFYKPIQYFSTRNDLNNYSGWYYFYDFNAKVNYKVNNRNKISLNYFRGTDRGRITEKQIFTDSTEFLQNRNHNKNLRWFTTMGSVRLDKILSDKTYMVTTAGVTLYNTRFDDYIEWETKPKPDSEFSSVNYSQSSGNRDLFLKLLFEMKKYYRHQIVFGGDLIYHAFNTGSLRYSAVRNSEIKDTTIGDRNIFSTEQVVFIEDRIKVTSGFNLNAGISFNSFQVKDRQYSLLQPRISGILKIKTNSYLHFAYTRMQQNLQILPNNSVGLPVDIWIPVTDVLKPQISDQISLGFGQRINKTFKISLDAYYKWMDNLVELKEGNFFVFGGYEWDKSFYTGSGKARGIEVLLEKQTGKIKGWIGYALSKSDRLFEGINKGESFPFKYDRRHQITAFAKAPLGKKWKFSVNWIFTSGMPVTIPTSVYTIDDKNYYQFTERNNVRMSNYHRMDISFVKSRYVKKQKRTLNLGAYNVYSHVNPMFISSSYIVANSATNLKFFEVGLLPIVPFISYEISF